MLDNITATNQDLIDTRVGELTLERERLEAKLESLVHLTFSDDEVDEVIEETKRFAASLRSLLREGSLEDQQTAARRCVVGIVVDRNNDSLGMELRRVPTVGGTSLGPETDRVIVVLDGSAERH